MIARTRAVTLTGLTAHLIEVEAVLGPGLPGMSFTGLADTSVVESRDRIRSALHACGMDWPNRKITVALFPADVRKIGSRFDLAIAMSVLAASERVRCEPIRDALWLAELGLDGRLRPVRGVLPAVAQARERGVERVVVAPGNGPEAALVPGVDVRVAHDLARIVAWLDGDEPPLDPPGEAAAEEPDTATVDLAEVSGQVLGKRAIEVAAAGSHHLLLEGAPGAGKTMLAERLPGLLPDLDDVAALEVSAVHSVAGLLGEPARLLRRAPFQAPHHSASLAALVGGGSRIAQPGAISLAHRGVLFLDEAPEFAPGTLEALRQPLEGGRVVLHRSGGAVSYPARFLLVLAANPCPCGARGNDCLCAAPVRRRYQQRLSGPLLDRIDLRVHIEPVAHADLLDDIATRESSAAVAARVAVARAVALDRWQGTPWRCNGEVPGSALRLRPWRLPRAALGAVEGCVQRGQLSARGFDRVLRLAWTLADLGGRTVPSRDDVGEALFFRTGQGEVAA